MRKNSVQAGQDTLFPKLALVPENEIRAAILHYLKSRNVVCSITDATPVAHFEGGHRQFCHKVSQKGWPDITAIHPLTGKFWGIECKTPEGYLSPDQKAVRRQIEDCYGIYTVARSIADVAEVLDNYQPKKG